MRVSHCERKRKRAWEAICSEGESNDSENEIFIQLNFKTEEEEEYKSLNELNRFI